MIGFNELGTKGWLGNQMFQYAGLRGIASHRGYDFCIPPDDLSRLHNYSLFELFELKYCKNIQYINAPTYFSDTNDLPNSCSFHFSDALFHECPDNVNLNAFFQSEKYFIHIEKEIREDFTFKNKYLDEGLDFINSFEKPPFFLHVRRGDLLRYSEHYHTQTTEYYSEAIAQFDESLSVVILSDDIEWCKQQEIFRSDRFIFYTANNRFSNICEGYSEPALVPYMDLCIMSLCSGGITSNSSFSWWGAWLINNENKIIVSPKKWFGPALSRYNMKDLMPDNWIKL